MKIVNTNLTGRQYIEKHPKFTGILIDEYEDKFWCRDGQFHREDGPAIERPDGSKAWYRNGEKHRIDGPAIEWSDGDKNWYINNQVMTKETFIAYQRSQKLEKFFNEDN